MAEGMNRAPCDGGPNGLDRQPAGAHTSTSVSSVVLGCRNDGGITPTIS